MNVTVLADYSHLFHICRYIALNEPPKRSLEEITAGFIETKTRTLDRIFQELGYGNYDLIFVEDRMATRKMAIMPGYKEGREDSSEEKTLVKQHLRDRGIVGGQWVSSEGNEADDVIATLTRIERSSGNRSIVVTGDRDLWQLIDHDVDVFHPIKKRLVVPDDIESAFAVGAAHVAIVKSLWGDAGDGIPNVMPRQKKHLLPIVRLSDGTIDDCHSKITEASWTINSKCWEMYQAQAANVRRNYELVKLDEYCDLTWD